MIYRTAAREAADNLNMVFGNKGLIDFGGQVLVSANDYCSRYRDPAWTYGTLPPYNRSTKQTFPGGTVEVLLNVQKETIINCKLYGDFFATGDMNDLATDLCGTAWTRDSISRILMPWLAEHPIHNISPQDILVCFFPKP